MPGNLNLSFDRIEADSLILALRRFAVSAGSACSSRERGPSRILNALGVPYRITVGKKIKDGKVELLTRATRQSEDVAVDAIVETLRARLNADV